MSRFVLTGLLAVSAMLAALDASAAALGPEITTRSTAPTPDEQRDLNCLDAATQQWRLTTSSRAAGSPSAGALSAVRAYYLGRLSVEVGDTLLDRYLHDPMFRKPVDWAQGTTLSACVARMEHSNAVLRPAESRNFALEPARAR
jgi:hypothetical protein